MDHNRIYQSEAERYDRLISYEDVQNNVLRIISTIVPNVSQLNAVDIGAGTGRLAKLLSPLVRTIRLTDVSQSMLEVASKHLTNAGMTNWTTVAGPNDQLPLPDNSAELLTAGWTICYSASINVPGWENNLQSIMNELTRVIRKGGTAIIFENYGTGSEKPDPPQFLIPYYQKLQEHYGFQHTYIRTDFEFNTIETGAALIEFFFGTQLKEQFTRSQSLNFPECTGIWWKHF